MSSRLERKRKWVEFLATVSGAPRTHRIKDDSMYRRVVVTE